MKKYKTWEAIKMLNENPKLMFQALSFVINKPIEKYLKLDDVDKIVKCISSSNLYNEFIYADQLWILVSQPVDFMEAVKAYDEGKTIRCELNGLARIYGKSTCRLLVDNFGAAVDTSEILKGKWFIEDGEE